MSTLEALRLLFSFGVPGGRTRVQKAIGRYLDGDVSALEKLPTVKTRIDLALSALPRKDS